MAYVIPSHEELKDWFPTQSEFEANPEYYWNKLREDEATPWWCRHFGMPEFVKRFFRR